MARNIEIKARVPALDVIRTKAASLASGPSEILDQTDTFFGVLRGRLKVREFPDGSGELISYDRPNQAGPKESVYSRFACQKARALVDTLASVLPVRGIVVKRREVFLIGRTRVHLDQVENLGSFVELEVVLRPGEPAEGGEREAHELLRMLNLQQADLVAGAYIDLIEKAA